MILKGYIIKKRSIDEILCFRYLYRNSEQMKSNISEYSQLDFFNSLTEFTLMIIILNKSISMQFYTSKKLQSIQMGQI